MKKSCYLSSMELTPNNTFILRVFTIYGVFPFIDTERFELKVPNCFMFECAEYETVQWFESLNLKIAFNERSNFYRKLNSIFYEI